jgi:hypothetical protein
MIASSFSGGVDDVLVELGSFDKVLVDLGGSPDVVVEQPEAATATPTTMAAASRNEISART